MQTASYFDAVEAAKGPPDPNWTPEQVAGRKSPRQMIMQHHHNLRTLLFGMNVVHPTEWIDFRDAVALYAKEVLAALDPAGPAAKPTFSGDGVASLEQATSVNVFRLESDTCFVAFAGESDRFRTDKGFVRIQRLLQSPFIAVSALVLTGSDDQALNATFTDADPNDASQEELIRLWSRIKDAEENLDHEEAARLREKFDMLTERASKAGARPRRRRKRSGPAADAADAVWKSIQRAYDDMNAKLPKLVLHFENSIHRAEDSSLIYEPSPAPRWDF